MINLCLFFNQIFVLEGDRHIYGQVLRGKNSCLPSLNKHKRQQTSIEGLTCQHEDYIAAPMGGTTIDVEARSAINDIINALVTRGIINPQ